MVFHTTLARPSQSASNVSSPHKLDDLVETITAHTLRQLYNYDADDGDASLQDAFITRQRLDDVWMSDSRLEKLLPLLGKDLDYQDVKKNYIQTLSTMVYIGAVNGFACIYKEMSIENPPMTDSHLLLVDWKSKRWKFSSTGIRNRFAQDRYIFCPYVIKEYGHQQTDKLAKQVRLPFINRNYLESGSYGDVDKVEIPLGYLQHRDPSLAYTKAQLVACKETKVKRDWHNETEKLNILRESLASHASVMLHKATLMHGDNYLILLPLAEGNDLNLLLNNDSRSGFADLVARRRGENAEGASIVTRDLLMQSCNLVHALDFLHRKLQIGKDPNVYCAHMDLKPGNILIDLLDQYREHSEVGFWKISDFGLSVFDQHGQPKTGVLTTRDAPQVLSAPAKDRTIQVTPLRAVGTYQAPEVNQEDGTSVGRRSDVWSFACVFSEVLTYAVGGPAHVKKFRDKRLSSSASPPNDYFHSKVSDSVSFETEPKALVTKFKVRKEVDEWLKDLPSMIGARGNWLGETVKVVRKYLVVEKRPDSEDMYKDFCKLCEIYSSGNKPDPSMRVANSLSVKGSIKSRSIQHRPSTPQHTVDKSSDSNTLFPSVGLGITNGKQLDQQYPGDLRSDINGYPGSIREHYLQNHSDEYLSLANQQRDGRPPYGTSSDHASQNPSRSPVPISFVVTSTPPTSSHPSSSNIIPCSSSNEFEQQSTSVKLNQALIPGRHRRLESNESLGLSHRHVPSWNPKSTGSPRPNTQVLKIKGKAIDVSVEPDATKAAWLFPTCVRFAKKMTGQLSGQQDLTFKLEEFSALGLEKSIKWEKISVARNFVAVWGRMENPRRDHVYVRSLSDPGETLPSPPPEQIPTLLKVVLSPFGHIIFICETVILCATSEIMRMKAWRDMRAWQPIYEGQIFSDAALSNDGKRLYAWSYRTQPNLLYVWLVEDATILPHARVEYDLHQTNNPRIKLLPYNHQLGSIMQRTEYSRHYIFFPAQFPYSNGDYSVPARILEEPVSDVLCACVFRDISLITIEKKFARKPVLKEYIINCVGDHIIDKAGKTICELESKITEISCLTIVTAGSVETNEATDHLIVCNADGSTEIIHFELRTR